MSQLNPDRQVLLAHIGFDKRIVRAEGNVLFDSEGNRYLDCLAQYGALPFGHNPAFLWAAVEQVRLAHEPSLVQPLIAPAAEALAAKLVAAAPCAHGYVTFTNSGAETVEAAIKMARARTRRPSILATHSFRKEFLSEANLQRVRDLNAIAGQRGQSLAQIALAWVLRDPRMSSTLIGASNSAQIRENVGALGNLAFTTEELQAIDTVVDDGGINIWQNSSSR